MALTFGRWVALVLAGFAVVPIIVSRDATHEGLQSQTDRVRERSRQARLRAGRAAETLRSIELRDAAMTAFVSSGTVPEARRLSRIDPAFDSTKRAAVEALLRDVDASAPRATAHAPATRISAVFDTTTIVRGMRRRGFAGSLTLDYVLPAQRTDPCLVIAHVQEHRAINARIRIAELGSDIARDRLLGPCSFVEQYGLPGPAISRWLAVRGWTFAQRSAGRSVAAPVTIDAGWDDVDLIFLMDISGVACAAGNDSTCLVALLEPSLTERRPLVGNMMSTSEFNPFMFGSARWRSSRRPLGSLEWRLLSDMAADLGPERFTAFWRSQLEPVAAFRAASGSDLAAWTREWIHESYHWQRQGPSTSPASIALAVLVVAAAMALSLYVASRRQVA